MSIRITTPMLDPVNLKEFGFPRKFHRRPGWNTSNRYDTRKKVRSPPESLHDREMDKSVDPYQVSDRNRKT